MKKIIAILFFFWTFGYAEVNFVPGEILVKTKATKAVSVTKLKSMGKSFGIVSVKQAFPRVEKKRFSSVYRLKFSEKQDIFKVIASYKKNPDIEYAEPNYIVKALYTPNDPFLSSQWAIGKISAKEGWDLTMGTVGVTIAIIDTGIDLDHGDIFSTSTPFSDLKPKIIKGWDYVNEDPEPDDDNGHGSHVAGIASGLTDNGTGTAGLAGSCRLLALKVLDKNRLGYCSDVAYSILEAVEIGAKVINMSLGGSGYSQILEDACDYAKEKGVLVIAAAGNNNSTTKCYPAGYDSVMAVAATDGWDKRCTFSNYGDWVDISAPGGNILSTYKNGAYKRLDGTSMAAPFVSGLAGLLFSYIGTLTAEDVKNIIKKTADNLSWTGGGAGRINVRRALEQWDMNIPPEIKSISISDNYFSPGTSGGSKDTVIVTVDSNEPCTFSVKVDNQDPDGASQGTLVNVSAGVYRGIFIWNGSYTSGPALDGTCWITATVFDEPGSSASASIPVVIDRIWPSLSLNENTGGQPFYRGEEILFNLKPEDNLGYNTPFCRLTGTRTGQPASENILLSKIDKDLFRGYYTVKQGDYETWTVSSSIEDLAGNSTFATTTVYLNGMKDRPSVSSRIVRISLLHPEVEQPELAGLTVISSTTDSLSIDWPEESLSDGQRVKVVSQNEKYIWSAPYNLASRTLTLDNSYLYYGSSVSDYRTITVGVAYALKTKAKKADKFTLSLQAMRVEKKFLNPSLDKANGSLTVQHQDIKQGYLLCISSSQNCWLGIATDDGSFTISNQNLYSGPLVTDYTGLSALQGERVAPAPGGEATIEIGGVTGLVALSDDGVQTAGDLVIGDGIYSNVWTVVEVGELINAGLKGHLVYNKKKAVNDPYKDDRLVIKVDSTPPVITNNSASPVPFNPHLNKDYCEIKYNLSEKSWVKVKITDKSDNLIRTIASPEAQFGDNVKIVWDGRTSGGVIPEDDSYWYYIEAEDEAGNFAKPKKGEICLTSVVIKIKELSCNPNPFYPNKENPATIDTVISFKAVLENAKNPSQPVTTAQLNNLNFDFEQYCQSLNVPYALIHLRVYDSTGKIIVLAGYPDLSGGIDRDHRLNGIPNYGYGIYTILDGYSMGDPYKPDEGDGNVANDQDTLCPFDRDGIGNYYCNFSYGWLDWNNVAGTYIVEAGAELVSIRWALTSDPKESPEKWHGLPAFGHYGVKADMERAELYVKEPPPPEKPDTEKPEIIAIDPAQGDKIDVLKTGSLTEVYADLDDGEGSGVNMELSEIFLVNVKDEKIAGKQFNDTDNNRIEWVLDIPLAIPGSYTIKVKPVDKKKNGIEGDFQRFSFRIKDSFAPMVFGPFPESGTVIYAPFAGPVRVFITEAGHGESAIDGQLTTLSLSGPQQATLSLTYLVAGPNSVQLKGELDSSLTIDGTYTMSGKAYDVEGNFTPYSYSFYLKRPRPVVSILYPPKSSNFNSPYKGTISVKVYQEDKIAGYEIDWLTSTIFLFDPNNSVVETVDDGSLKGDFEATLTYKLSAGSLGADGTCRIEASIYNKKGYSGSLTSFFSVRQVQPVISNPYPTGLSLKKPYTGIISVDISTEHYGQAINQEECILSLIGPGGGSIGLITSITAFSTQSVRLIGTPTTPLIAEGSYTIKAKAKDIAGNGGGIVEFLFDLSWYLPLVSLYLSPPLFSPYTSIGIYDITIISFSCDEDSTYTITIDDRGLKNAEGTILANGTVYYAWDGMDQNNGTFTEGTHTIKVSCKNMVGKIGTKTLVVTIDNIPPEIKKDIVVSDYIFSPGTSAGSQDTTKISFTIGTESATYTIKIDGKTPTGIGSSTGFLLGNGSYEFIWNGSHTTGAFSEGTHTVEVEVSDFAGNTSSKTAIVTIDRTWPCITAITNNTGGQCFYRDEVVVFILYADLDVETATTYLSGSKIKLQKISSGIFSGSYIVKTGDSGVLNITGSVIDEAGNPNADQNKIFGTITVDGSQSPSSNIFAKIIRIGALLPKERGLQFTTKTTTGSMTIDCSSENLVYGQKVKVTDTSGHIWVADVTGGTATLDNSNLYFGSPVPDYRNTSLGTVFALKTMAKGGDQIGFSISCVKVEKRFSPALSNQLIGSLTLSDSNIKTGETILVGAGSNFWLGLATVAGSFTISNANLYSGPLVCDYRSLSGLTCEKVSFAVGGDANIDIGTLIKGIPLADTGLCGDLKPGDGVYSGLYTIKNGDDGQGVLILGHFWYNKQIAQNDGWTDTRIIVSLDGTPPKITNISVQPLPFNPYLGNLNINYTLSEKAYILIKIENKNGELVRRLVPPNPQQGENVDAYWDGSDNMGDRVLDGSYYYSLVAEDLAGNIFTSEKGEVKVTSLEIGVESFHISPNPFPINKPDKNGVYFTVKFRITLKSSDQKAVTEQQLNNLGFYFTQSSGELNYPYGLLSFGIYDPDNKKLERKNYPDMTPGVDIDPWLNIWLPTGQANRPNYADIDINTPSCGDEDRENDYGNLIAFLRDEKGNYYTEYEYAEKGWSNPAGIYTHRLFVELVSLGWKPGVTTGWHAEPHYWGHYGLRSDVIDRQFEAKEDEPPAPQDTIPPSVNATDPTAGTEKEQGKVSNVSAILSDNQGGVGVDIGKSEIRLFDSKNALVPGSQTNNGVDTIYWNLEGVLNTPGSYTIKIIAIDKKPNAGSYTFSFTVKDKMAPKVTQTSPVNNEKVTAPYSGPILVFVSDEDTGGSAIDSAKTTMSLTKGVTSYTLTYYYATETANYKGKLVGTAGTGTGLTESGTYTVTVWVYDVAGNGTSCSFSFIIPENIRVVDEYGNTLDMPYDTEIDFGKAAPIGSGSVQMKQVTNPPGYSGYRIVGKAVSFYYGTVSLSGAKFTKSVILTLGYTDTDLAGGDESKLYIYGRAGGSWSKLGGSVDKNANKIAYIIAANIPICEMYAIMTEYSVPKEVSQGIYARPNPAKGETTFVVGLSDNANVNVEVYTLSGDLVWEGSKYAGAGDCLTAWKCTNKAGRKVGTGLYIYKVTIEYDSGKKEEFIKKLVVIKQ
ncbi:MAG: S8 family serine peptidase [bacterium]|nr:S8 family serine peptidase [bacterium]